jgi:alkanesulfonate monooxygenase SsuD/methylene tetrahydromethanopterin reductase-like flavin-dependent oxidoreductase (luciferase family)
MPRVFLQRLVHVAETDEKAYEQARQYMMPQEGAGPNVGGGPIAQTRIGWGSNVRGMGRDSDRPDDKARGETMERSQTDYQFNIDNGLAVVGSPETVIRKLQQGQDLIGYDIFCTNFIGPLAPAAIELWGKEVIPAFQ